MGKKHADEDERRRTRYEYRVWGKHRSARKKLSRLADETTEERVKDCYLLGDDVSWNAKVRDNTLKIKQVVSERKGFEQWESVRLDSSHTAPSPFDDLFDELRLGRAQRGKSYDLRREVTRIDPDSGVRAVFVTKYRRHYRIGDLRAEVTDIEVHDTRDVLHTLSIEGDDLPALVALRKELGLRDEPNIAVHEAIEAEAFG
jgi:hypothetical protein